MKFGLHANTDISELGKDQRAYLIQRRTEIDIKYCDVIDELLLVAQVGNADEYGEEPLQALQRIRAGSESFDLSIDEELKQICNSLQRSKLETLWEKEGRPGAPEHSTDEEEAESRVRWVSEQIKEKRCAVSIEIPKERLSAPQGAVSRLKQDRQICNRKWTQTALTRVKTREEEMRQHPAAAVTVAAATRQPLQHDPARHGYGNVSSGLTSLFSRAGAGGPKPNFLKVPEAGANRRQQVTTRADQHRSKMMGSRQAGRRSRSAVVRRPPSDVQPRVSAPAPREREVVLEKEAGQPVGVTVHPSTLVVLEAKRAPAGTRGMKVRAVSATGESADLVDVGDAAALRRQLQGAVESTRVLLVLEQYSERLAVAKRKSEFRDRMCSAKSPKSAAAHRARTPAAT